MTKIITKKEMNKVLNSICKDCICLGKDCNGTSDKVWTGCVYRKVKK